MKDLKYYKDNATENYITTPISVLRYITELEKNNEAKQLNLSGVVKCNCDESEQLEEEFEIHHLINDTYQVIGKDSNTVWKQGTLDDCNEFVML